MRCFENHGMDKMLSASKCRNTRWC